MINAAVFAMVVAAMLTRGARMPQASSGIQDVNRETATQVYLRFRATVPTATKVEDITTFWGGELMHEFTMTPEADKPATLDIVKRLEARMPDVKVIKETATESAATLQLQGTTSTGKPVNGTVELVKENGAWKLAGQENWYAKE